MPGCTSRPRGLKRSSARTTNGRKPQDESTVDKLTSPFAHVGTSLLSCLHQAILSCAYDKDYVRVSRTNTYLRSGECDQRSLIFVNQVGLEDSKS